LVFGIGGKMENYSNIWAVIKDGTVIDTIYFTGEEPNFIEGLKLSMDVDDIISGAGCEFQPGIGWGYDYEEKKFTVPSE
jgi:hypothetical protein